MFSIILGIRVGGGIPEYPKIGKHNLRHSTRVLYYVRSRTQRRRKVNKKWGKGKSYARVRAGNFYLINIHKYCGPFAILLYT